MHRAVLLLIIALLPLRAWVGDAMAFSTTVAPHLTHEVVAQTVHPCHGAQADAKAPEQAEALSALDMGSLQHTCSACDVCHSAALASTATMTATEPTPLGPPARGQAFFASAERRSVDKPPIA